MLNIQYQLSEVKTQNELTIFVKMSLFLVNEIDKNGLEHELQVLNKNSEIHNYFILKSQTKVGVVKIFQGNFFHLGLIDDISIEDHISIFSEIENNILNWRVNKIEATIDVKFSHVLNKLGYHTHFTRKKMHLNLSNIKNLSEVENMLFRNYSDEILENIADMATDAYRGTIDEEVGIFSGFTSISSISSIINNEYGLFRKELSPILTAENSDYVEAATLTTINEKNPFIVLIGVRKSEQSKGLGRKLLSYVIKKSINLGYESLSLWVTEKNDNALRLYNSVGFVEITSVHTSYKIL